MNDTHTITDPNMLVTYAEAAKLQQRYSCSGCWGHLEKYPQANGAWAALCPNCETTKGYVSQRFIEKRESENIAESMDARRALADAGVWMIAPKTEKQLLKELGF